MTTKMLEEVVKDGEHIKLTDGSLWQIDPYDMSTVCTWLPTIEIEVKKNDNTLFNYTLTNRGIDVSVKAMRML